MRLEREATRKWLREFASIVLGVLVALSLGAVATQIGWWTEVRGARGALAVELGELMGQAEERRRFSQCVERRLDAIAAAVDRSATERVLPPVGDLGSPPYRSWTRGVWDSNVSAQTAAHFDRDELDNYSALYEYVAQLNRANQRELEIWTALYAIVGPGRALEPGEVTALRATIREARLQNRFITLLGVRMRQVADAFDLTYDRNSVAKHRGAPDQLAICKPIPLQVPARYGQAPLAGAIERAERDPIRR